MFPGYNFSARRQASDSLLKTLNDYIASGAEEILRVPLEPVTNKMVRSVSGGRKEYTDLSELTIARSSETSLEENKGALELRLAERDLDMLVEAVQAIRDGVGDFSLYKGRFWLWPCTD